MMRLVVELGCFHYGISAGVFLFSSKIAQCHSPATKGLPLYPEFHSIPSHPTNNPPLPSPHAHFFFFFSGRRCLDNSCDIIK